MALETLEVVLYANNWKERLKLPSSSEILTPLCQVRRRVQRFNVMICFPMVLKGDETWVKDAKFKVQYCEGLDQLSLLLGKDYPSG